MSQLKLLYRTHPISLELELKCPMCQSGWCRADWEDVELLPCRIGEWQCQNPLCQWQEEAWWDLDI